MKYLFNIAFFGLLLWGSASYAQTATKTDSISNKPSRINNTTQELDTEESLKYVGNQLLFQIKKRLHLTDEEEEKRQAKDEKAKKLTFFGIEIERD